MLTNYLPIEETGNTQFETLSFLVNKLPVFACYGIGDGLGLVSRSPAVPQLVSSWIPPAGESPLVHSVLYTWWTLCSTATVKQIGEKEHKDNKVALILEILGIIFAFIPFLDELGPSLGIADGAFEIAAATGNVALAIQEIVADPASALYADIECAYIGESEDNGWFHSFGSGKEGDKCRWFVRCWDGF